MTRNLFNGVRLRGRAGRIAGLILVLTGGCSSDDSVAQGSAGAGRGGDQVNSGGNHAGNNNGTGGSSQSTGTGGSGQSNATGAGGDNGAGTGGSDQNNGGGGGGSPEDASVQSGSGGSDGGAAGAGGAKSDGGTAGAGGSAPLFTDPQCLNGKKDGTETGVDCGGSCPACVNYKINGPSRSNNTKSSCDGGSGYMCPRSMVFSPELKQAAMDDWSSADPPFVYGTAGHDADSGGLDNGSTCCQCYQLVFESPVGVTGLPVPKPMIVQSFNTAAGGGKAFDVYMAVGGYGANNGCIGGSTPMYSQFPDMGGNYSGGVRATRYTQCATSGQYSLASVSSSTCQDYVGSQCSMIKSIASTTNQTVSQNSCVESNFPDSHYHVNWNVRAKRVECPDSLTKVTGCKLNGQGLPKADPAAQNVATADSSFKSGYHTTTMQDCCRPTCAYSNNVSNSDSNWSVFYTCDKSGNPTTQ